MTKLIEQEFDDTYGLVHRERETRQRYLDRVVARVDKTTDDDWEKLTADAQRWFNTAFEARKNNQNIPDFPDAVAAATDDQASKTTKSSAAADDDEEEDDMATTHKAKKRRVVKPPTKKRAVHTNGSAKLATSGSSIVKRAMLRNMNITDPELEKILKAKDYPLSPVRLSIVRNEFRHSVRLLQEEELLNKNFKF